MKIVQLLKEAIGGGAEQIRESRDILHENVLLLKERLAELEFALEDKEYSRVIAAAEFEFSRDFINRVIKLTRIMYLKNPMIRRAVDIQGYYVWAQGFNVTAKDPTIQEVLDDFVESPSNADEMFSVISAISKDCQLSLDGNLFLVFFTNVVTGEVTVRSIDVEEIAEIRTSSEDVNEVRFYKRVYTRDSDGKVVTEWYPDIDYLPISKAIDDPGNAPVNWNTPILHIKEGGLPRMRWGIPYIYVSLDWAQAYKAFLEDWATIMRAYARMAMHVSGLKGKDKVGAAKTKLQTNLSTSNYDTNPPNTVASWLFSAGGVDVKAIKTAGATTSAEEGRPLKLMVAAGVGLPDTFFGDANVGNFATSKTLDRPTELKFMTRQRMWMAVFIRMFTYVLSMSAKAPKGKLRMAGVGYSEETEGYTHNKRRVIEMTKEMAALCNGRISRMVEVKFPSILERNVTDRVRAVVNAITLFGKPLSTLFKKKRLVAKWLLEAMNEPDAGKLAMELYPDDEEIPEPPPPTTGGFGSEDPGQGGDVGDNG